MKGHAKLIRVFKDYKKAKSISESLEVDNYSGTYTSIETKNKEGKVKTEINLKPQDDEAKDILRLSNTINDLIISMKISEKLLE